MLYYVIIEYPLIIIVLPSRAYRRQTRIINIFYYNIILCGNRQRIFVWRVYINVRAGVVFGERLRHYIKHNTIDTPRWLKLTRNIRNDKQVDTIYIYILQRERDTDDGRVYNNIEVYTYDNILLYIIVSTLYFLYIFFSLSLAPSRAHRDVDQQWNNSCIGTCIL